jgi:hypothetical protein
MHSALATQLRREQLAATHRLTPEQRLEAFLVHNRLMAELYKGGLQQRIKERVARPQDRLDIEHPRMRLSRDE